MEDSRHYNQRLQQDKENADQKLKKFESNQGDDLNKSKQEFKQVQSWQFITYDNSTSLIIICHRLSVWTDRSQAKYMVRLLTSQSKYMDSLLTG